MAEQEPAFIAANDQCAITRDRALLAFTAASEVPYLRLAPHRWAASQPFCGGHNREAMLRLCPTLRLRVDVGPAVNHTGSRSGAVIAESLEAP